MSVPSYLIEPLSIIWRNGPISDPSLLTKSTPKFRHAALFWKSRGSGSSKSSSEAAKKALNSEA